MGMTPGLSPNIRLDVPTPAPMMDDQEPDVEISQEEPGDGDNPTYDDKGNLLRIDHADGSITVSIDGRPIGKKDNPNEDKSWFANLADDKIDEEELSKISEQLLRGINDDIDSRSEWMDSRAQGLRLLGLSVESPNIAQSGDGAPVEGMSKVRHPLLLEAVLRYQANARGELLPTDGPVKITDNSNNGSSELDELAEAFQKDFNHYLTKTATEYYPDTDRMLFMQGFGGCGFKKIYNCPLRNRPVSESVDADDLIVNNIATDLANAKRVTHRMMMRPSVVKRMQLIGAYRDVELSDPQERKTDAVEEQKADQQGVSKTNTRAEDRDREIFECYCELNIPGFEHKRNGKPTGLEVPYRVTIDKSSQKILSVVRNFDKPDGSQALPIAKVRFVKYPFVPGLGFYDIGLLNILGNTTNAITAGWRELLDAGMFASFPGFLYSDQGARQNTNIFRVPPGGGAKVNTGGQPISNTIMPLPYKEPSGALMQLVQNMSEYGQRVGGTAEMAVGEGKQDAPVGTTLAVIEQATKVLNAVHKRLHTAQSEEFQLLVECFRENPQAFWQNNKRPAYPWDEQTFREALDNYYLNPQADPNTASSTQRLMKASALIQLASSQPGIYNMQAVNKQALRTIGFTNIDEFLQPDNASPTPEVLEKAGKLALEGRKVTALEQKTQAEVQKMGTDSQVDMLKAQNGDGKVSDPARNQIDAMTAQADLMDAHAHIAEVKQKADDSVIDGTNRQGERESRERLAQFKTHNDMINNATEIALETMRVKMANQEVDQRERESMMDLKIAEEKTKAIKSKPKPKPAKPKKPGLKG